MKKKPDLTPAVEGFTKVPNRVHFHMGLSPNARALWATLEHWRWLHTTLRLAHRKPSIEVLCQWTGLSRRGVLAARQELIEAGLLEVTTTKGGRGRNFRSSYVLKTVPERDSINPLNCPTGEQFRAAKLSRSGTGSTTKKPEQAKKPVRERRPTAPLSAPTLADVELLREALTARKDKFDLWQLEHLPGICDAVATGVARPLQLQQFRSGLIAAQRPTPARGFESIIDDDDRETMRAEFTAKMKKRGLA